jgi:hypothetical protein
MRRKQPLKSVERSNSVVFPSGKKKTVLLAFDEKQYKQFRKKCIDNDTPMSVLIRTWIKTYVEAA